MRRRLILVLSVLLTPALAADPAAWQAWTDEVARLTAQENFASALPVAVRALEQARQFGAGDPRLVYSLNSMGALSHHVGKSRDAERAFLEGTAIVQRQPGQESALSQLLDNLATVYYEYPGREGEAESLRRRALDLAIQTLGPEHSTVGIFRSHLALSLLARREYGEARTMLMQAMGQVNERDYPVYAADICLALGSVEHAQRNYAEAIRLFVKASGLFEKYGGDAGPRMILPLQALAEVYLKLDRPIEADAMLQRALRIADSAFGADHPRTAEILSVRVRALRKAGKRKEAKEVERRARAIAALPVDEWKFENNRVHVSDLGRRR